METPFTQTDIDSLLKDPDAIHALARLAEAARKEKYMNSWTDPQKRHIFAAELMLSALQSGDLDRVKQYTKQNVAQALATLAELGITPAEKIDTAPLIAALGIDQTIKPELGAVTRSVLKSRTAGVAADSVQATG